MNDNLNEISVEINTIENPKDEELTYFYQINEEEEIESSEKNHTFTGLSDGKYVARGRAETLDGVILSEKEMDVTIAYETVYVSSNGNDESGNGSIENLYATLQSAYNKVKSGGNILLLSDITVTSTTNMDIENKEVTLRSDGKDIYSVVKDSSFTEMILDIKNSNTITTTNITFDGNDVVSTAALIESKNSTVNLNEGTTVTRNNNRGRYVSEFNNTGALGGGLFVWQSTLNINGASVINNKTSAQSGMWSHGAGICMSGGILNLNSGTISYNENIGTIENQVGGGIVFGNGTFTINGGTISYNNTPKGGGGVFLNTITSNTVMIMNGGEIINNKATGNYSIGGGIYAFIETSSSTNTIVYLKGGMISNNTAWNGNGTYASNGAQIFDER